MSRRQLSIPLVAAAIFAHPVAVITDTLRDSLHSIDFYDFIESTCATLRYGAAALLR